MQGSDTLTAGEVRDGDGQVQHPMVMASGSYNVLAPIPHEIVFGLVAFGVLYLVMSRVLLPRLEKIYAERHDRIEGTQERAAQARAEAERVSREYRVRLGEAREEAGRIRDAAREEGQRQSEEVLGRAREESTRIVTEGRQELEQESSRLRGALEPDIARLSRELAGRILGRTVADEDHRDTVDRFLNQRV